MGLYCACGKKCSMLCVIDRVGTGTLCQYIIRVKIDSQNTTSICWSFLFVCHSDYMFRP
jgi:hypothetical protein